MVLMWKNASIIERQMTMNTQRLRILKLISFGAAVVLPLAGCSQSLAENHVESIGTFETSAGTVLAEQLSSGLVHPWGIAFLPDGNMLVTEREGRLRVVSADGQTGPAIAGVPDVLVAGQGGLLDIHVDSNFADNAMIYMTFSSRPNEEVEGRGAGTAVLAARLELDGLSGQLVDQKVIFRMNKFTQPGQHFGSRIVEGRDGNLWVTLGDRGEMDRAQDPFDLAGGVVRIAKDGTIPQDNPFADGVDGDPAFWSIGHRNAQGATLGPNGALWTVEHGAKGGDEINMPEAGKNYGWPHITYGVNYNGRQIGVGTAADGYEQPIYYWDPSIAPSGLTFYEGDLFSEWSGDLLVGALRSQTLVRLEMDGEKVVDEERLFEGAFGRIRDVEVGPDGAIYLATDSDNGRIIRVSPDD